MSYARDGVNPADWGENGRAWGDGEGMEGVVLGFGQRELSLKLVSPRPQPNLQFDWRGKLAKNL
jgi:hypothetical protein